MRVAVVGGGIGGLTAALLLGRAGLEVTVFEQAGALREVGAGIQISPNASRILHRAGLAAALGRIGVRAAAVVGRRWDDGRELWRHPLGEACVARYEAPYYHLHRADLVAALAEALPAGVLRLHHRVTVVAQSPAGAELALEGAGSPASAGPFDVVVGADGIHSAVRGALFGAGPATFSGSTAYRGLVPEKRLAHLGLETNVYVWLGPGRHLVHYFVAGGRLVNFVAVVPAGDWRVESWSARGEVADAVAEFAGWHPHTREVLAAADATHRWALFDREPLPSWVEGRVALLGDAAHSMLPFLAQGAGQAIEDAAALAACLRGATTAEAPEALRRYEAVRQPRAAAVQAAARCGNVTYHLPDGPEQEARDAADRAAAESGELSDWLYGYDVEAEVSGGC
jgi:salicylate hydroxylase